MKEIEVRYRFIGWLPIYRRITREVPQNWGEVKAEQLIAIACLMKYSISEMGYLSKMTGISEKLLKKMSDFERYHIANLFEFVGDNRATHAFIIRKLEFSPVLFSRFLYSPADKLKGLTFGQFIFADSYFMSYQESKNDEDLNRFIACLYLPMNEKFDADKVNERAKLIGTIKKITREAIVINWQLIHEWLGLAYPLVFQKMEEEEETEDKKAVENRRSRSNTWIKIFRNLVGDDILKEDEWAAKPVNSIFAFITRKYKENARKQITRI